MKPSHQESLQESWLLVSLVPVCAGHSASLCSQEELVNAGKGADPVENRANMKEESQ